jgi:hypothetical protein
MTRTTHAHDMEVVAAALEARPRRGTGIDAAVSMRWPSSCNRTAFTRSSFPAPQVTSSTTKNARHTRTHTHGESQNRDARYKSTRAARWADSSAVAAGGTSSSSTTNSPARQPAHHITPRAQEEEHAAVKRYMTINDTPREAATAPRSTMAAITAPPRFSAELFL